MNKKFLPVAALLLAGAAAVLAGCSFPGMGTTVYRNPYEVATGTGDGDGASEWLADNTSSSTEARKLYEEAQKEGFEGSFVDFLKEVGTLTDPSGAVNRALLSAVDVYAAFEKEDRTSFRPSAYSSIGSGVIYTLNKAKGDAYIVTNYHVVYSADSLGNEKISHISDDITLFLYGSELSDYAISATYLGGAMNYDIAVLKVEGSDVLRESSARAVAAADSDAIAVGEEVYAVGNPDNRGLSAVSGVISVDVEYLDDILAADETTELELLEMRTDAPVNHGNSGGGLFNGMGELVGIVNARSEKDGVEHFGYAIPSNLALAVAQNIIDNASANSSKGALRATLGITVQQVASKSYFDEETGRIYVMETIAVQEVTAGSPCRGKLQAGDVICSVKIGNGEPKAITRMHMLTDFLFKVRKNDTVTMTVSRGTDTVDVSVTFSSNDNFTLFA